MATVSKASRIVLLLAITILLGPSTVGAQGPATGHEIWVSSYDARTIVVLDAETLRILDTIAVPGGPEAMGLGVRSDGSERIFVNVIDDEDILVIDPETRSQVGFMGVAAGWAPRLEPVILNLATSPISIETRIYDSDLVSLMASGGIRFETPPALWLTGEMVGTGIRFQSPDTARILGLALCVATPGGRSCVTPPGEDLFLQVDFSDTSQPTLPGVSQISPTEYEFPTIPDVSKSRHQGCDARRTYEIIGNTAYVVICDDTLTMSVAEAWDLSTPTPTVVRTSAPITSVVAGLPRMLVRPVSLTLPAQAQQLLSLLEQLADQLGQPQRSQRGRAAGGSIQSLIAKARSVIAALDKGNDNAAGNKLGAFVNEVEAMTHSDQLTEAQGRPLVVKAESIIDQLDG